MRTICALLVITLGPDIARADEATPSPKRDPAAVALLEKAAEAMKKAEIVRYDVEVRASGWVKEFVPDVDGSATVGDQSQWEIDRFHCRVRITDSDGKVAEREAGSNGEVFFLIDPSTKTAHEDMDPTVLGPDSRTIRRTVLSAFASPKPLKAELAAESIELGGSEDVAGVPCDRVNVVLEGRTDSWFFAKSDGLPRRVLRKIVRDNGEGAVDTTLRSLTLNPKIDGDPFALRVPAGYRKTDEFPK